MQSVDGRTPFKSISSSSFIHWLGLGLRLEVTVKVKGSEHGTGYVLKIINNNEQKSLTKNKFKKSSNSGFNGCKQI